MNIVATQCLEVSDTLIRNPIALVGDTRSGNICPKRKRTLEWIILCYVSLVACHPLHGSRKDSVSAFPSLDLNPLHCPLSIASPPFIALRVVAKTGETQSIL